MRKPALKLISNKTAPSLFERELHPYEREAVFNVSGQKRNFSDSEKGIAFCIIDEMQTNHLLLQCDCRASVSVLSILNQSSFLREASHGGFGFHAVSYSSTCSEAGGAVFGT